MVASAINEPLVVLHERFDPLHARSSVCTNASPTRPPRYATWLFEERFATRFSAVVERHRILVYGEADAATREALNRIGASHLGCLA